LKCEHVGLARLQHHLHPLEVVLINDYHWLSAHLRSEGRHEFSGVGGPALHGGDLTGHRELTRLIEVLPEVIPRHLLGPLVPGEHVVVRGALGGVPGAAVQAHLAKVSQLEEGHGDLEDVLDLGLLVIWGVGLLLDHHRLLVLREVDGALIAARDLVLTSGLLLHVAMLCKNSK
jgi:hypothetical protein